MLVLIERSKFKYKKIINHFAKAAKKNYMHMNLSKKQGIKAKAKLAKARNLTNG